MKKTHLLLLLALLLSTTNLMAYGLKNGHQSYVEYSMKPDYIKEKYTFRNDYSKEAKKIALKWQTPGILHSSWIENFNGKSIDLQGNTLFPDVDYDALWEVFPDLFIITSNSTQRCGLITRDGKMLVPMDYQYFNEAAAKYHALFKGTKPDGTVDVFNFSGLKICSIPSLQDFRCHSTFDNQLVFISYNPIQPDSTEYRCYFWYNNGVAASEWYTNQVVYFENGRLTMRTGEDETYIDLINAPNELTIPEWAPQNKHWVEFKAVNQMENNEWIKAANIFIDTGEYKKAAYCLEAFSSWDDFYMLRNSSAYAYFWQLRMECDYHNKRFSRLLDKKPSFLPDGVQFIDSINGFYYKDNGKMPEEAVPLLLNCIEACNELYRNGLVLYKEHSEIVAAEKEKRARRQARLNAISNYLNSAKKIMNTPTPITDMIFGNNSQSGSVSGSSATMGKSAGSGSSSSSRQQSSSSGREKKVVEKHTKCNLCGGTGHCKTCGGTGKRVYGGKEKTCAACSGHTKCTSCDGRGYKISYENQ